MPDAYIHRLDGHLVARPRRWEVPALVRFMIGIWPASLTAMAVACVAMIDAL